MQQHFDISHIKPRSGFSLMELLIVMTLLVVVAGIAAPNLVERMRDNVVARGSESVREVLAESRTHAIDSGIDYQFRYEPNGHFFVVLPAELEPTDSNSTSTTAGTAEYVRISGELDSELFLKGVDPETEKSEQLKAEWFGGLPDAAVLSQKAWSDPIIFHFDGSATDRTFLVADADNRTAELTVRGLTGGVRLAPVYQQEAR